MRSPEVPRSTIVLPGILAVGTALRLALTLVNREANDDHLSVARIIADEGRAPGLTEVWEAFQPKLYHLIVAVVWKAFALESETARVLAAQLVSCFAGIATTVVVLRFLQAQPLTPRVRALSFALLAWNPGLIAINAQATNDSLVILLGTVALASGSRFFWHARTSDFWAMTAAAAAATVTKGNGLVLSLAIAATGALPLLGGRRHDPRQMRILRRSLLALLVSVATALACGPYRDLHAELGSPLANPGLVGTSWPDLFEKTAVKRPGVRSLAEAFLTFPLADLVEHPILHIDDEVLEQSRTSFWAQLYGRAHFTRYASCPPSWRPRDLVAPWLGSVIMVIALIPTAVLVLGFARQLIELTATTARGRFTPQALARSFLTIAACGYLAMTALYAAKLRDFAAVKEIFLYPALLAFVDFFARELERISLYPRWLLVHTIVASGALLATGYLLDLGLLVDHLAFP